MKTRHYVVSLCCVFVLASTHIQSTPLSQDMPIQYGFGNTSMIQNTILLPPETIPTENRVPNYVFLDPNTEAVIVKHEPLSFSKEAQSFKSHRLHYIAFWGLFFLMRGTQWGG